MSRFIQGDCVRVMATFPGNAVDFILTDRHISSVSVTVPGAPSPAIKPMSGCNRPVMKCSAC